MRPKLLLSAADNAWAESPKTPKPGQHPGASLRKDSAN